MPKKKKIQLVLLGLLLVASVGVILRFKYQAFSEPTYVVKGFVFSKEDNRSLPGVTVTLSAPFTGAEDASSYTATTDDRGSYNLNIPTDLKWGNLTFTKDGFFDTEGLFDFTDFNESSNPAAYTYIDLKPGFGREVFVAKFLPQGFSSVSFPFTPLSANPQEVFTFKNISEDENGFVFQDQPFLTDYSQFKLKLYYQGSQQNPVEYKPSQGLEITAGQGYYLQNDSTDSLNHHVLVVKGKELQEDFSIDLNYPVSNCPAHIPGGPVRQCVPSPAEPIDSSIANPFMEEVSTDELQIIDTWDANKEYSLNEAIEANLIDKNLKVRIGLGASDFKPPIDITSGPQDLTPTVGAWLLKDNRGGLRVRIPLTKAYSGVELPSEISPDAAKWAYWVDPDSLDDSTYPIWEYISERMLGQVLVSELNNQSASTDSSPVEDNDWGMDNIYYSSYQGKIISGDQGDNILPPVPNITPAPGTSFTSQGKKDWKGKCREFPNELRICVDTLNYFSDGRTKIPTISWSGELISGFQQHIDRAYPVIKEIFGSPILNKGEKIKTVRVEIAPKGYFGPNDIAIFYPDVNVISINEKYMSTNYAGWTPVSLQAVTHELFHAWRDEKNAAYEKGILKPELVSWEEGQVELSANLVMNRLGYNTARNSRFDRVIEAYDESNQPMMLTTKGGSWKHSAGYNRYFTSAAAWLQIYSEHPTFFHDIRQGLSDQKLSAKQIVKNAIGSQVGTYSFDYWYEKQWSGLVQTGHKNKFTGWRNYIVGRPTYIGQYNSLAKIANRTGWADFFISKYNLVLYKSYTDATGAERDVQIFSKKDYDKDTFSLSTVGQGSVEPGKRFTYVSKRTFGGFLGLNKKTIYAAVNVAQPKDNAGIYGVVSDLHSSSVTITPLKPRQLNSKNYPVVDGYFQSSDRGYGWDAGTYELIYTSGCRKDFKKIITKSEGKRFYSFRIAAAENRAYSANTLWRKAADILGLSKSKAEENGICYPDELKIENIKTVTQSDGSVKLTFTTSRLAVAFADWGLTNEYDLSTDLSNEPSTAHAIIFSPVTAGQKYHYNITAIDATGRVETEGMVAESTEEEMSEPTDSTESGDQTFTPCPSITNIQVSNISSTAARVSWIIEPGEPTALKYGTDPANLDQSVEINSNETSQSITLSNLTPNTTYHYRVEPQDQPECACP